MSFTYIISSLLPPLQYLILFLHSPFYAFLSLLLPSYLYLFQSVFCPILHRSPSHILKSVPWHVMSLHVQTFSSCSFTGVAMQKMITKVLREIFSIFPLPLRSHPSLFPSFFYSSPCPLTYPVSPPSVWSTASVFVLAPRQPWGKHHKPSLFLPSPSCLTLLYHTWSFFLWRSDAKVKNS